GRAFLSRMRDREQSLLPRMPEHRGKLRRRMADLRGIEAHCGDAVTVLEHLIQRVSRFRGTQMTQEARDEPVRHPEAALRLAECATEASDDGVKGDPARGVCLRIEKDLRVDHALLMRALQVGDGQMVEVVRI